MVSGRRLDQLCRHPHAVACLAHAALEHIDDTQTITHVLDVDGLTFERERRIARDNED